MLKIARPQMSPKKMANKTAAGLPENTKYMAYPPDKAAKSAVKNMVAPMPTYLLCSVGKFFRVPACAPEQNQKKSVIFFINHLCFQSCSIPCFNIMPICISRTLLIFNITSCPKKGGDQSLSPQFLTLVCIAFALIIRGLKIGIKH